MSKNIKLSPEAMESTATRVSQAADKADQMNRDVITMVENLKQEWSGVSEEYFYSRFEEWKKLSDIYESELREIGEELKLISSKFKDTDLQLSRSI